MANSPKRLHEEDQDTPSSDEIYISSIARRIEIFLNGPIKTQEAYTRHYQLIRNAGPLDEIHIYINSNGGAVASALQFIRAMQECQAQIHTSVEGECMSAATMIFLYGDVLEVSDNSLFLFHNYRGGIYGKGGELYDNAVFEREWSIKLIKDIYKNFLTDDEIEQMMHGRDFWMGSEEVLVRAQVAMEARAEEARALEQDEDDPKSL